MFQMITKIGLKYMSVSRIKALLKRFSTPTELPVRYSYNKIQRVIDLLLKIGRKFNHFGPALEFHDNSFLSLKNLRGVSTIVCAVDLL